MRRWQQTDTEHPADSLQYPWRHRMTDVALFWPISNKETSIIRVIIVYNRIYALYTDTMPSLSF